MKSKKEMEQNLTFYLVIVLMLGALLLLFGTPLQRYSQLENECYVEKGKDVCQDLGMYLHSLDTSGYVPIVWCTDNQREVKTFSLTVLETGHCREYVRRST